ncbi:5-formyltetrahydrofolate cyclo-ligase [Acidaminobacter sp. JC074]|uniref:5-formyltetrahydrofolate cyclo-ligase n=1 Tax=Acidaminobacter sp. JC074 TaxID=2530199 RepID=UPI001F0E4953|nr:5-formyltetrahydrofolate cyclo-ligase [Acidaminobacter sp. JC074]
MKKIIRKESLKRRKSLTKDQVIEKSHTISQTIIEKDIIKSKNTLIYMDFRNEVMTKELLEYTIEKYGSVLLPRVVGDVLTIHEIFSLEDMILSELGILEPGPENQVAIHTIDLILAPGVAFDEMCYRLGYGGGFYDRLLSNKRKEVPVIALAFETQIIDKVPTEPHDYKMDMVVTENRIIKPSS